MILFFKKKPGTPSIKKTFYVDIDGTICNTSGNEYLNARPIRKNIRKINRLFKRGHTIVYWTARGKTSGIDWYKETRQQLIRWGCRFHSLSLDKPSFDVVIDDRALNIDDL